MRTNRHVSARHVSALFCSLSIAIVLAACGTSPEKSAALPDGLEKDLAVASASSGDLAIARQSYQRMRFVSGVEQTHAAKAPRPKAVRHVTRPTPRPEPTSVASNDVAPDPMAAMAQDEPAPTPTVEASAPEAPTVIAEAPVPAPSNEPASAPGASTVGAGDHGNGGGLGGILGAIGAAVIRGGAVGVDHCDPRHDGRPSRPPTMGMPVYSGGVFGGVRRR